MSRTPTVSIIKDQIHVSDMRRTPTVCIIKAQLSVSDVIRIATVIIIKYQIPVIYLSRTPNSKHTKEPDTSQSYEKNSTSKLNKGQDTS